MTEITSELATAAARRIQADGYSNDANTRSRQFIADADLLAGFVLAGLREVAEAAYSRGWQDAMREENPLVTGVRYPDASVGAKSFPQQGDATGPAPGVAAVVRPSAEGGV